MLCRDSLSKALLSLTLLLSLSPTLSIAQTNFIPLERGDVREREERLMFTPGVQLSGDFRFRTSLISGSELPESRPGTNSPEEFSFDQDVRLKMQTIVHPMTTMVLELATAQEPYYQSDLRDSSANRVGEPDSQTIALTARQSYLDLNFNPRNTLRIGKQEVNVGDRRGKVFNGVLTGFAQPKCRTGTWCYEFGGYKLSTADSDWLYSLSLDYPFVYQVDANDNPLNVIRAELFRIKYTEHDIPVGAHLHPAMRPADDNSTAGLFTTSTGDALYYNAHEQEYFGIRFLWDTPGFRFYFDATSNIGNRRYFVASDRNTQEPYKVRGVATEWELTYKTRDGELSLLFMGAQGDKELDNQTANYQRALEGYYEIVPGTYQGTQFYFNGGSTDLNSGTGLGHSINNTQLLGLRYLYRVPESDLIYHFGLYQLKHLQPVLSTEGNPVKEIGVEWDNTFSFPLAKHVKADLDLNVFQMAPAFRYRDADAPLGKNGELLTHVAGRLIYSF